jgi:hypothetical protein
MGDLTLPPDPSRILLLFPCLPTAPELTHSAHTSDEILLGMSSKSTIYLLKFINSTNLLQNYSHITQI